MDMLAWSEEGEDEAYCNSSVFDVEEIYDSIIEY